MKKVLEDLEEGEEGSQAAAGQNSGNSKLDKIGKMFNLGQNVLNGAGQLTSMFAQQSASGETEEKSEMPAYLKASFQK